MNELFVIPVNYRGTEQEFKARFKRWGYTHRIAVLISETTVTFKFARADLCLLEISLWKPCFNLKNQLMSITNLPNAPRSR
jgi:hypothetical protein